MAQQFLQDSKRIRPLRQSYVHDLCQRITRIGEVEAVIYACKPDFYSKAYCDSCKQHYHPSHFKWLDTDDVVGT
jgi:hypothetical protein